MKKLQGSQNKITRGAKKKTSDKQKSFVSYDGFEPSTHALKGRCSTY